MPGKELLVEGYSVERFPVVMVRQVFPNHSEVGVGFLESGQSLGGDTGKVRYF